MKKDHTPASPLESGELLREALQLGLASVTERWHYRTKDWVSSVHANDIDGDDDPEVLLGSRDGTLYALSKRGGPKWKIALNQQWVGAVNSISKGNATGETRVIAASRDNQVYGLDKDGQTLWTFQTKHVVRQIFVYDVNLDGKLEVILGSEDRHIYVLDSETGALDWQYSTNGWIRTVFAADIDGDGNVEILGGSGDKHLYVLDSKGQLKWKHDMQSKIHTIFATDLDNDGVMEILIGSDAKVIHTLTPNGQPKWPPFPIENRVLSIFVADINRDGHLEIIASSEDKHIYFLNHQGKLLWRHNLDIRVFSVFAADLNHDGSLEVLVGAEDDCIHVLSVELPNGLLTTILKYHTQTSQAALAKLHLDAPKEYNLLRDLTTTAALQKKADRLPQAEHAPVIAEHLQPLAAILRLSHQKAELLWSKRTGHVRALSLSDLNGDHALEIVVGTDDGKLLALNQFGKLLWSRTFGDRLWTVQIGDVDQDGVDEVIIAGADSHVYVLNHTGKKIKWQGRMDDWIRDIYVMTSSQPEKNEMVLGSEGKKIHLYGFQKQFYPVIDPIQTSHFVRAVCAYDLNNDGIAEIVAGLDTTVEAYTRQGKLLWRFATQDRIRSLCIKDIDADGEVEVLVGSEDRNLYVLDQEGHLKWRYYTPHRVLTIDAVDINQTGQCTLFLGSADGYVYVLNAAGDLLWRYPIGDRVRAVQVADCAGSGRMNMAVGSENQMTYLLQLVDQQQIDRQIEACWTALQDHHSRRELIDELAHEQDPYMRAFALVKLAEQPDLSDDDLACLEKLVVDPSEHVRLAFARMVAPLYRANPDQIRRYLDLLVTNGTDTVKQAFVESLPQIVDVDSYVGFDYLERFTKDSDRWVRRAVVRGLYQLVSRSHQQVLRLLLVTARDEKEWVKEETARTLALYFATHQENLVLGLRLLVSNDIEPFLIEFIAYRSKQGTTRNLFLSMAQLLSTDLDEVNILERLHQCVKALYEVKDLPYGTETWRIYQEFYELHRMNNVNDIAEYTYNPSQMQLADHMRFERALQVLGRLTTISEILRTYQRREGIGARLASLLDAVTAIEKISLDLGHVYPGVDGQRLRFPDRAIFKILLTKWRAIVTAELSQLRGKAVLKAELRTRLVRFEEQIGIWLSISNEGRSPADNVQVRLKESADFILIEPACRTFESISEHNEVHAEFTLRPRTLQFQLTFELCYDDAEGKAKIVLFGDRLELQAPLRVPAPIANPYIAGTPIHNEQMFYGRQEDLLFLKENLTLIGANMIVVLYGQRRSGKSSLLYKLINNSTLDPHIPVYIDMQNEAMGLNTSKFLRALAFAIERTLSNNAISVPKPVFQDFDLEPSTALNEFLYQVEKVLSERKLVLMIDEFEILEQKVKEKALDPDIFMYLRSLMQHQHNINFLLSGTHTIKQLTAGYWSSFFNIARHHKLSKLSEEAAAQLISMPTQGTLEYDPYAIQKIRQLSADQPYLIQLICRSLVEHCNREKKGYATINDVNTVISEVMETGQVHFQWVWEQSSFEEHLILSILAQEERDDGRSTSPGEIEKTYRHHGLPYNHDEVIRALQDLVGKDILEEAAEGTRFRVPVGLIRVWLQTAKPLKRVLLQERLPRE